MGVGSINIRHLVGDEENQLPAELTVPGEYVVTSTDTSGNAVTVTLTLEYSAG